MKYFLVVVSLLIGLTGYSQKELLFKDTDDRVWYLVSLERVNNNENISRWVASMESKREDGYIYKEEREVVLTEYKTYKLIEEYRAHSETFYVHPVPRHSYTWHNGMILELFTSIDNRYNNLSDLNVYPQGATRLLRVNNNDREIVKKALGMGLSQGEIVFCRMDKERDCLSFYNSLKENDLWASHVHNHSDAYFGNSWNLVFSVEDESNPEKNYDYILMPSKYPNSKYLFFDLYKKTSLKSKSVFVQRLRVETIDTNDDKNIKLINVYASYHTTRFDYPCVRNSQGNCYYETYAVREDNNGEKYVREFTTLINSSRKRKILEGDYSYSAEMGAVHLFVSTGIYRNLMEIPDYGLTKYGLVEKEALRSRGLWNTIKGM